TDVNSFDVVECSVELTPRDQWKTAKDRSGLTEVMNRALTNTIPGVEFQFSQMIEDNVNEAVSGIKSELSIKLFGDDPYKLQTFAQQMVSIVKSVPGAVDVG